MSYKPLHLNCSGRVFFGPAPFCNEMIEIKNAGAQIVWNLLEESDILEEEKNIFSEVVHSPIPDYSIPNQNSNFIENLNIIENRLINGQTVFIHCFGGRGRTGMALAALLMRIDHLSAKEALDQVYQLCRGPETEEQKDFVCSLEKKNA